MGWAPRPPSLSRCWAAWRRPWPAFAPIAREPPSRMPEASAGRAEESDPHRVIRIRRIVAGATVACCVDAAGHLDGRVEPGYGSLLAHDAHRGRRTPAGTLVQDGDAT